MRVIADSLNFPTSLTLGEGGAIYVAESGLPFGGAPRGGKVWRISPSGERICLLEGLRPPVNGLNYHDGALLISEGGHPGRISRFDLRTGVKAILVDNLPGFGNYQTNMVVVGPDGKLYFSQGAMTNSGIIGLDSHDLGWLRQVPHHCDIPGYTVVLTGISATTRNPLIDGNDEQPASATTGAFAPFGSIHPAGMTIPGTVPCTSAVMRCNPDGTELELVAWGLRNAYGLGFHPDGRLFAIDQGADVRGSRPLSNCPDALFVVRAGAWYGWPDFVCGRPVTSLEFLPPDGPAPAFALGNHAQLPAPEQPLLEFPIHSAAAKFDFYPSQGDRAGGGQLLVALFGDERPLTGPPGPRVGRQLLRVDLANGTTEPLAAGAFHRPIDVRFDAAGSPLVLDFGEFEMTPTKTVCAKPGSGSIRQLEASDRV